MEYGLLVRSVQGSQGEPQELERILKGIAARLPSDDKKKLDNFLMHMQGQALYDSLTGLFRKEQFENRLDLTIADQTRGYREDDWVILFDMDCFKDVNDKHGHAYGDRLLHRFGTLWLPRHFRPSDIFGRVGDDERDVSDIFGRVGGDELAVIAKKADETVDGSIIRARLKHIVTELEASIARMGPQYDDTGVSAGATNIQWKEESKGVLARAEDAMYFSKSQKKGRPSADRVHIWDQAIAESGEYQRIRESLKGRE